MVDPPDGSSNLRWKSFAKTDRESLDEASGSLSPGSIFVDPTVEPDKVVLRPHNRNHSALLSPRDQDPSRDIIKKSATHADSTAMCEWLHYFKSQCKFNLFALFSSIKN